jgi:hypothetical protein
MVKTTAKQPSLPRASRPRGYVPSRIERLILWARNPRSTSNLTMMTMPPQDRRSVTFYVCPLLLVHAHAFLRWVLTFVRADAR